MEAVGVGVKKKMEMIKSAIGSEIAAEPEEIPKALSQWNDSPDVATKRYIIDNPDFVSPLPLTVKKIVTSTGARILTQINQENHQNSDGSLDDGVKMDGKLKEEVEDEGGFGNGENPDEKIGCKSMEIDVKVNENEQESVGAGVLDGLRMAGRAKEEVEDDGGLGNGGNLDENLRSKSMEIDVKVKENNQESEGSVVLDGVKMAGKVKDEVVDENFGCKAMETGVKVKENDQELEGAGFLDGVKMEGKVKEEVEDEGLFGSDLSPPGKVKEESDIKKTEFPKMENEERAIVKKEVEEVLCVEPLNSRPPMSFAEYARLQVVNSNAKRRHLPQKERAENNILSSVLIEDGDFPEEPEWLLVGRNVVMGLSTTKGRKLENNEIIHFSFPSGEVRSRYSSQFVSSKAAFAASGIVRFSTKRNGEIGRLPMEWSKCLIPLVNSSKVKVLGQCIGAPTNLHLMQDIMLYLSFYIHCSVFSEGDKSSWRLESPSEIDATTYPLLTLFKLLKINPFQEAEFTPEELDSRKRALKLSDDTNGTASMLPMLKRRKGGMAVPDQSKDEQAISESSLNKLVGAADMYDLQEMEPPETLMCDLRPYQKQALFWMTESEKGIETEEASKTLHPCWGAYKICDERAPAIYVNVFSGEAATQLPTATETARGGILADAMGLGKTVMTIALIHARRGRGSPNDQEFDTQDKSGKDSDNKVFRKVKGGTLIVCPMALLGQWKDELESHSNPDSLSVSVYYGSDRSTNPRVIAEPDVILTTYGVLTAAYKTDGENSIFHRVEWYRVVLDEAHTIKSSRTQGAQAAFKLSSYCRWCLTGTPLQNNLEDLYSLLCFLHVEPWCNWAWWQKLIQKPYENGDPRGLKLIKAILRPLMLRRTKDTKDKTGRPILVLPPTDIRVIDCEQSEAEHDFYDALFKRSKVQFDQFVAQGKVLHNYANILELLLRLRQCCNHPFLVMSRADTNADLNKLARKFLETNPDSGSMKVPSEAYVEEVVEGLKKGEKAECPICLESADDPVLTPCAHRMCRECLLSCWRTPSAGACPICRQVLKKTDLITCPSKTRFRIDVEKNWTESSKVSKLLDCLSKICRSGSGEKSIVFSQWTSFLDLLEIPLRRKGIGYLRFDGSLAQKQRERVLKEFNETEEKMVLLMSLKAGGVGLNLTAASNVFLMDPWWNPAVEEQAIMRIHRIGQKRTVRVRRFIVKDTVEERLQQVQARKQRMIAGALTDEEVRSTRLEELKMLFR